MCAVNSLQTNQFWRMINENNWIDLGFFGGRFKWSNGRSGMANIKERIDRAWSNVEWYHKFLQASVKHLLRRCSDHHPILLSPGHDSTQRTKSKGFRMLTAWFSHLEFEKVVMEAWPTPGVPLMQAMDTFRRVASQWNRLYFGHIFQQKEHCNTRLARIRRCLERQPSRYIEYLEVQLMSDLDRILGLEEDYWRQKARER